MDILKRLRNTQKSEPAASILEEEIKRLQEELDIWKSVFPDIAPESVQPDRSLLEKEIERLREALAAVKECIEDKSYIDAEMIIDTALKGDE